MEISTFFKAAGFYFLGFLLSGIAYWFNNQAAVDDTGATNFYIVMLWCFAALALWCFVQGFLVQSRPVNVTLHDNDTN